VFSERCREQRARLRLIVHRQYADPGERRQAGERERVCAGADFCGDGIRGPPPLQLRRAQRKPHCERRPAPHALALGCNHAAVQLDQLFNQRQPQSQPAVPPRARHIVLAEAVEDREQERRLDAFAVVRNAEDNLLAHAFQPQFDAPARGRELDCVLQQVPGHLL